LVSKPLLIVESPAKARTIERLLGSKYKVRASMGHVRDLPKSRLGVDTENGFSPRYITIRGKGRILKQLKSEAARAARVYLATDPDREGEAISWHLADALGLGEDSPCRVVFQEVTGRAVRRAIEQPRSIDRRLVDAQQARRILDRLVGYKLSPLLWRKVKRGLSAGRVQSVAVRLICDREREIEGFKPEEYWTLTACLKRRADGGETFEADYYGSEGERRKLSAERDVDAVVRDVEGRPFAVASVRRRQKRRRAPDAFTTSTLQQEAARKLRFNARRTMMLAQQLYEGLDLGPEGSTGLVTYIRTDSTRVANAALAEARDFIKERYGSRYASTSRPRKKRGEGVQDAHEAIRPTSVRRTPDDVRPYLNRDQLRLYTLIWQRFVASRMTPAVYDTVTADIAAGPHIFRATGSTVKFKGFMTLYVEGREDETEENGEKLLPALVEGERLQLLGLKPAQHFTKPPPRYTEAQLVKALEENGIGRPSTYAPIIETIQQRGYVAKENRRFKPTPLGVVVVDLLKEHFAKIIDVEFTARLEGELDRIEEGRTPWREVVEGFYGPFSETLEAAEQRIGRVKVPEEETDQVCEKCGRKMVIKHGRYGRFLACPGFPECRNTKPLLESAGVKCPECGSEVVVRRGKKGRRFYGCSAYPKCTFSTWYRPLKKECPECGAFLVRKKIGGRRAVACVRDGCGYIAGPAAETDGE